MGVLENFINIVREEFNKTTASVDKKSLTAAAAMIIEAKKHNNRLHITGIGKPSHAATYAASLFSSTGTPAYYLHGTEAVHGSCGQLVGGDIVICITNSGETDELKATATAVRNNGCKIIAVTGKPNSWIGKYADICLPASVSHEGGVLNRAPRASIIAEIFVLQCLSILLQEDACLTPDEYIKSHPGGMLGQLRDKENQ
ncbi:MAG: SIS domain-containing protein [Eubacteriales bacterium]|nr:SIS domain-containing protein [Eubacteriales bacterium]